MSLIKANVFLLLLGIALGSDSKELPKDPLPIFDGESPTNKIVGGVIVTPNELPYQLSLQYKGHRQHFCGAAIISNNYAITAAHCVQSKSPSSFVVVAGEHRLNSKGTSEVVVPISKIVIHEAYNSKTVEHDIALLEFSRPLEYNGAIKAATLPNCPNHVSTGSATISGWGKTSENSGRSEVLRKAQVNVLECRKYYNASLIKDSMICAGYEIGGTDTCQGDSGGPLILGNVDTNNGSNILIGIVSWGVGCARPKLPGVYTDVAKHLPWIKKNARGFPSSNNCN